MVSVVHNLPLNSDILVLRPGNAEHGGKLTESYKLLTINNETCKVQLLSSPTNFRITTIKPYLQEPSNSEFWVLYDLDVPELELGQLAKEIINDDNGDNINTAELPYRNPARTYHSPTRFKNMADIFVFLILKSDASQLSFTKSRHKNLTAYLKTVLLKLLQSHIFLVKWKVLILVL